MRIPNVLMPQRVLVEAPGEQTPLGRSAPAAVEWRAHVEESTESAQVWLDLESDARAGGHVTLHPGTAREERREITSVTRFEHPRTPSHLVADLGGRA